MKLSVILGVGVLLIACNTSTTITKSCNELAASAQSDLQAAITQNASCRVDADCTTVAFASDCFDSCSRAAAASGKAAIDTARDTVNQGTCQDFISQGCTVTIPPCAPSDTPKCTQGVCQ